MKSCFCTFRINSLDLICGLAGQTSSKSVQGSDSIRVPLTLSQTSDLTLQLRCHFSTRLPFICSSLTAIHIVASDGTATIILWRFPGKEDPTGRLVSPPQVLWRIRNSCWRKKSGEVRKAFHLLIFFFFCVTCKHLKGLLTSRRGNIDRFINVCWFSRSTFV